jgi:hypothetical protein
MKAGGSDDDIAVQYLPLLLSSSTRAWLEQLEPGSILYWGDFRAVFIGHFQSTHTRPRNSWDLRNCKQRPDETLREYIQRFSKKHNELPNITDTDVINAFICGTTYEMLIHALDRETPRMMRELLDIAT